MGKEWQHRATWVEIDLDAIEDNIKEIRNKLSINKIMGVVKADAYGHGAVEITKILIKNGVEYLAVAMLEEAIALRKAGIHHPILVLGYTPEDQAFDIVNWDILQTVYRKDLAYALSKEAIAQSKIAKIHLKVDTGMGRLGFRKKEEILEVTKELKKLPNLEIQGIFTHFSSADERDKEYTLGQLQKFNEICEALDKEGIEIPLKHVANSATTIDIPKAHFDLVRLGIILYGLYPSQEVLKEKLHLKPAMTFKTKISHIKRVPPHTSIGYGRKFTTKRESMIATLPVGYADGYSRMLSNKGEVLIKGKRAPIVGNICMDQCMVDVTELPRVQIEDEVILFGEGLPVEEVAGKAGTIHYEIISGINKRVPKVYKKEGQIKSIKNELLD